MQVEVTAVDGTRMAEVRTSVGDFTARWCGKPDDAPGVYDVEWTIDTELARSRNATASDWVDFALAPEEIDLCPYSV
jgi:hypothetical protein